MNKFISTLLLAGAAGVATAAFDPIVPFETVLQRGAEISRLAPDGTKQSLGKVSSTWRVPFTLGQMEPEFLFLKKTVVHP